jgi:hypothetical protein
MRGPDLARIGVLLALGGILGGSLASAAPRHRPDSGVRGQVLYGPTCPVQRIGQSCTRPYAATILVRRESSGRRVATLHSSAHSGRFSVRLSPGRYRLEPRSGHPYPVARPQTVRVRRHRFTSVTINYDSGIR